MVLSRVFHKEIHSVYSFLCLHQENGQAEEEVMNEAAAATLQAHSFISTTWVFFKTFFASLIPEGPQAIVQWRRFMKDIFGDIIDLQLHAIGHHPLNGPQEPAQFNELMLSSFLEDFFCWDESPSERIIFFTSPKMRVQYAHVSAPPPLMAFDSLWNVWIIYTNCSVNVYTYNNFSILASLALTSTFCGYYRTQYATLHFNHLPCAHPSHTKACTLDTFNKPRTFVLSLHCLLFFLHTFLSLRTHGFVSNFAVVLDCSYTGQYRPVPEGSADPWPVKGGSGHSPSWIWPQSHPAWWVLSIYSLEDFLRSAWWVNWENLQVLVQPWTLMKVYFVLKVSGLKRLIDN